MGSFGIVYFVYLYLSVTLNNKRVLESFRLQFEAGEREQKITESAELNKSILHTAMHGFLLADAKGRLLQVNDAYCIKTGYSEQELLTMRFEDLCALESPDELAKHLEKIKETGDEHFESSHRRKDGSTFPVEVSAQYKPIDGGLFVVFVHDISRRRYYELSQIEEEARLRKIAKNVPGIIYQFRLRSDGSSCFPFASEAINYIYRVSPEEVREDASKVFAIIHPDDYDDIQTSIQVSAKDLTLWHEEFRVKYEDGTVRWLLGNSSPEKEANGDILWHGFITDITEAKVAEQQLRIAAIALETQEGVMITDADGKLIRVNSAFINETGYSEAECIGKKPSFLKSDRHDAAFFVGIMEAVNKTGTWAGEIWNKRKKR